MAHISAKIAILAMSLSGATAGAVEAVTVYKSAACGCCEKWVGHMRSNGFDVSVKDTEEMNAVKARLGVPAQMRSCHTATVGAYVIEGHVPAADVRRLLRDEPRVAGLAAPGMPQSAPGMDMPGAQPYEVLSFTAAGHGAVYASH